MSADEGALLLELAKAVTTLLVDHGASEEATRPISELTARVDTFHNLTKTIAAWQDQDR